VVSACRRLFVNAGGTSRDVGAGISARTLRRRPSGAVAPAPSRFIVRSTLAGVPSSRPTSRPRRGGAQTCPFFRGWRRNAPRHRPALLDAPSARRWKANAARAPKRVPLRRSAHDASDVSDGVLHGAAPPSDPQPIGTARPPGSATVHSFLRTARPPILSAIPVASRVRDRRSAVPMRRKEAPGRTARRRGHTPTQKLFCRRREGAPGRRDPRARFLNVVRCRMLTHCLRPSGGAFLSGFQWRRGPQVCWTRPLLHLTRGVVAASRGSRYHPV
jgi:hypothetical protein